MLKSSFDMYGKLVIHGWAFDTVNPESLSLEIYLNDEYLDTVVANSDFLHLQEIKKIAGPRGFAYKFPEKKLTHGMNVIRVISKEHQACLAFAKSPAMDHLPFYYGEKDSSATRDYRKIESGVRKLISKNPGFISDFIAYTEDKVDLCPNEIDVLFVNGLPNNMSSHYRVHTVSELLAKNNYSTFSVSIELVQQKRYPN